MCEKKIVQKTNRFRNNIRLIERETVVHPVGIKSAQSVNDSHFFSSATVVAAIDDR